MPSQTIGRFSCSKNAEGARSATARSFPNTPTPSKVARRQFDVNYPRLPASCRRSREVERKVLDVMRNSSRKTALRAVSLRWIQKILTLFSAVI